MRELRLLCSWTTAAALLVGGGVSCASAVSHPRTGDALVSERGAQTSHRPGSSALVFEGRWRLGEDATCGWSGCALRFSATAREAVAIVSAPSPLLFTVELDGKPSAVSVSPDADGRIVLWRGAAPRAHTVRLVRQNEASFGPHRVHAVVVEDPIGEPTTTRLQRRIEVVGDSITCGYGVLGDGPQCPFSAETQSAWHGWAMRLGRLAAAETSLVAWSGIGVLGPATEGKTDTIHEYYSRTLPLDDTSPFTPQHPVDVVAIHLSTNDFSQTQNPAPAVFVDAFGALLDTVRAHHPAALIAVFQSPMLSDAFPEGLQQWTKSASLLKAALAAHTLQSNDDNVLFVPQPTLDNTGCDYHPDSRGAQAMAERAYGVLSRHLDWP